MQTETTNAMPDLPTQNLANISYLERSGSGRVVVFLHGIGSNAASFAPLFEYLPKDLRLIAWNAPGYMGSAPLEVFWPTAQDYAVALKVFLDAMEIEKAVLVGHSLGTLMATAFTSVHPERVSGLVLAASANGYGVEVNGQMPGPVGARIDELNTLGPRAFAKARAGRLVYAPNDNQEIVAQVERAMGEVAPDGYAQAVRMLASGDLSAMMAGVQTKPDFIIGAQDIVTPPEQTDLVAHAWQSAHGVMPSIHHIQGAGHAVYLQKPREFIEALRVCMSNQTGADFATGEAQITGAQNAN